MIKKVEKVRMGRDITIQCWDKTIILHKKIEPLTLYAFLKQVWRNGNPYIKYDFPIEVGWDKLYSKSDWVYVGKIKHIVNTNQW